MKQETHRSVSRPSPSHLMDGRDTLRATDSFAGFLLVALIVLLGHSFESLCLASHLLTHWRVS